MSGCGIQAWSSRWVLWRGEIKVRGAGFTSHVLGQNLIFLQEVLGEEEG